MRTAYLLLTEFEVLAVSYEPNFFRSKGAFLKSEQKKRKRGSVTCIRIKETNLVRHISYILVQIEREDVNSNKLLNLAGRTEKYST